MLKLTNTEVISIVCIVIFQKFINPLYIIIPIVFYYIFTNIQNKVINESTTIKSLNIDDIVQSHFKNTLINKNVYAALLSNNKLVSIIKELEIFKNIDKGNYRQIIYEFWSFLKLYVFTLKKKRVSPDVINELMEKRNNLLNSISTITFTITGTKSLEKITKIRSELQSELNNYIRIIKNKFDLHESEQPANVSSTHTIF